jgi:hypothetical protein
VSVTFRRPHGDDQVTPRGGLPLTTPPTCPLADDDRRPTVAAGEFAERLVDATVHLIDVR